MIQSELCEELREIQEDLPKKHLVNLPKKIQMSCKCHGVCKSDER